MSLLTVLTLIAKTDEGVAASPSGELARLALGQPARDAGLRAEADHALCAELELERLALDQPSPTFRAESGAPKPAVSLIRVELIANGRRRIAAFQHREQIALVLADAGSLGAFLRNLAAPPREPNDGPGAGAA